MAKKLRATVINRSKEKVSSHWINHTVGLAVELLADRANKRARLRLLEAEELLVVFVDLVEGKKLNATFRNKNRPTDILSFTSDDPEVLGELVFTLSVVRAQAQENDHSLRDEITYLIVHGILHLLGYDHEKSASRAKAMFKIQDDVFALLRS